MYGLLHGIEVTVRNAIHHHLRTSYGRADWYDAAPLSTYWRDQIDEANDKVKNRAEIALPGKVIAEMTFGFWVDLAGKHYNNVLWLGRKLSDAFPNTARDRPQIHARLKDVQHLRNRISHHERMTSRNKIYTGDASPTVAQVLECVDWICIDTAAWLKNRFRYAEAQRILALVGSIGVQL
jgi:hypothetical protein